MRAREDIEGSVAGWNSDPATYSQGVLNNQALILEVLLDILDRLAPKPGPRTVHPPSAAPPKVIP